ncbi:solute carrier family 23 member 2-like [Saccoglossus kowalevskii]|uniref:Solute carrier family 23 member 2-like n=1 Tax=Saccoglossus kowalevskii TaxID=10224 RepID=A0ABM0LYI1_SACKO|nr:PREDICTED: solute carrier family 23 member 2-like [Saccoglossus kowalevskii]
MPNVVMDDLWLTRIISLLNLECLALALTLLFSQYMRNIRVPYASWTRQKGCHKEMGHVFSLCPVILSVCITWFLCFTITDVFTTDSSDPSYLVRTDRSDDLINTLPWIWFPIPFRWGLPTVSVASFVGMMSAVFASTFESLGDYYACAHLSGAPPPPGHAVTRGIGVEGIGVIIAGMWGSLGVTSYSSSNGAISVTRVGNRRVIQWMSLILFLMAIVGKLAAIIASIPIPMIGGLLWITSGTIIAIGVASLQHCNMNSSRTLAIIGTAIMTALIVPQYLTQNPEVIDTGNTNANQIINVILRNGMIIGGLVGFILDNTIPGTQEERGLIVYRKLDAETIKKLGLRGSMTSYDLPFGMSYIKKWKWTRYIPFCPTFLTKDF